MGRIVGFCLAVATGLQAQPVLDEETLELDPLTVFGRSDDMRGEASAASGGRVAAAEIDSRPLLRRGEILEVVPGLVVTQHSGGGKANQYFLSGYNLDHGTDLSLAAEAVPINLRTHGHGQGYADVNFVIPEAVRGVSFRKGPFFTDVGDFSAAGYDAAWNSNDQTPARAIADGRIDRLGLVDPSNGGASERYSVTLNSTWRRGDASRCLRVYLPTQSVLQLRLLPR